jgi:hypothetical protein
LVLLAVAASGMKPERIKRPVVTLIFAWAALSGFIELSNREKIAWEPLVRQMIEAEPAGGGITRVYTSDYNVISTIQYYLDKGDVARFEVMFSSDPAAPGEEHYWVAVLKYRNDTHPLPQSGMAEKGFEVGDALKVETLGPRAYLFPVWRRTPARAPAR